MTDIPEPHAILYQKLTQALQTNPGATTPLLRTELVEHTIQAKFSADTRFTPESNLPPDLQTYITKVRKHAYKVTDEDIAQLHNAGYSEDAVFEITLSIALGAGTKCLSSGLTALEGLDASDELKGASDATTHA
jgi:hypothetical protein